MAKYLQVVLDDGTTRESPSDWNKIENYREYFSGMIQVAIKNYGDKVRQVQLYDTLQRKAEVIYSCSSQ